MLVGRQRYEKVGRKNKFIRILPVGSLRVGAEDANEPGAKRDRMRFAGRVFPKRKIGGSCKTLRNGRRMVCGRRSEGADRSVRSGPCLFHIYLFLPDSAGPVLLRPVRSRPVRLGPFEDRRSAGSSREDFPLSVRDAVCPASAKRGCPARLFNFTGMPVRRKR